MQGIIDWISNLSPTYIVLLIICVILVIAIIITLLKTLFSIGKNKKDINENGYTCPIKNDEADSVETPVKAEDSAILTEVKTEKAIPQVNQEIVNKTDSAEVATSKSLTSYDLQDTSREEDISDVVFEERIKKDKKATLTDDELEKREAEQEAELEAGCIVAEHIEVIDSKDKKRGKIEIYKDGDGRFRFRLVAANHEPVGHSQSYGTKAACKAGIKAMLKYSETEVFDMTQDKQYKSKIGKAAFEIYHDTDNKFRFRLRSKNYRLVLGSQSYTSRAASHIGIESVKKISDNFSFDQK